MRMNLFVIALCLLSLISCKEKTTDNREEMARRTSRPEAVLVETIRLEPGVFFHELVSNGKVYAKEKVVVPFRTSGTIEELNIINGQKVMAGDLMAKIEDFNYHTQLERAIQRLEKAEIDFKDDLLRNHHSTDTSNLPPAILKMSRIRSGLNEAKTSLNEAQYNYSNTRITAPISGRIANMEVKKHNHSSLYKSFCTIINDDLMEVEFPVIESEYQFVRLGMPVGIIPFSRDSVVINGTITEINPTVAENGMIMVRAAFKNSTGLIEGMNVKILIRKPEANRLVVPKEALVMRQGRDVIFIRQDTLAIWRYVTIEFENSSSLSIIEGLEAGDEVIVKGNINLSHETVVKADVR
jgi:membrane fusion protein, multidrug efflux system